MRDLVFFALAVVAGAALIALALVWPAGDAGGRPLAPTPSSTAAAR